MSLCCKIRDTDIIWVKREPCGNKISDTKECYEYKAEHGRRSIIGVF